MRNYGTTVSGGGWSASDLLAVWKEGKIVVGQPSDKWRQDKCGALISYSNYGTTGKYGWEVDHIKPVSLNGPDRLENLQPLQWENNRHKSDNYPHWSCKISSSNQ